MPSARESLYRRHRFPPEVISYAVWLYFRFPLSLRMVEEMLAARGICVTYETVRQWGKKFGKAFADQIRQRAPLAATNGIWTKSSSRSRARSIGSGAPIRMALSSTSWSSAAETAARRRGSWQSS
jgi:putative transposase